MKLRRIVEMGKVNQIYKGPASFGVSPYEKRLNKSRLLNLKSEISFFVGNGGCLGNGNTHIIFSIVSNIHFDADRYNGTEAI